MRGSRRSPAMWVERTSFTASLTRRIRSAAILMKCLVGRHHSPLHPHPLREMPVEPAFNPVGADVHISHCPADQRRREGRTLPEVVMVGLGDGSTEALVDLRLRRLELLPLSLEAPVVREVQMNLEDRDV